MITTIYVRADGSTNCRTLCSYSEAGSVNQKPQKVWTEQLAAYDKTVQWNGKEEVQRQRLVMWSDPEKGTMIGLALSNVDKLGIMITKAVGLRGIWLHDIEKVLNDLGFGHVFVDLQNEGVFSYSPP